MKTVKLDRLKKYSGEWVALDRWGANYKVLAHGATVEAVSLKAKSKGAATPVLLRVPENKKAYLLHHIHV